MTYRYYCMGEMQRDMRTNVYLDHTPKNRTRVTGSKDPESDKRIRRVLKKVDFHKMWAHDYVWAALVFQFILATAYFHVARGLRYLKVNNCIEEWKY